MTDARFPERWLNDRRVLRLPDDAFRLFVVSLAWSVANQTDGRLCDDDLALIPASTSGRGQLAKAGLWERVADYWLITVFEATQTSRSDLEVLENARRADREKKRRNRSVPGTVPGTNRRTALGQDRLGQAYEGKPNNNGSASSCLGCPEKPRHGCSTCWDHAYLEASR